MLTKYIKLAPTFGITAFAVLYAYAASLYPGGSQANLQTRGFDWVHNYWCNLTNLAAMNGQANPARPVAIAAMLILCASLAIFFVRFAKAYAPNAFWHKAIQFGGILSMFSAALIFTSYHDAMTIVASIFGVFVVLGIIKAVYNSSLKGYKISGVLCIGLLLVNNYIYYTQNGLAFLPLLQKITFAFVLLWVLGLNQRI